MMQDMKHTILLVEDDKLDQMAFKRLIENEQLPYDCQFAGSLKEAKDILERHRFDAVISDYSLGDGTAMDILELVKDTPVILVTGAGNEEVATQAWKAGAADYLIKDMDRNYLKTVPVTIENVMRHRQIENRLELLSHAITSTEDSVYITDTDGLIIFVNQSFCRTYGYTEDEIIGQNANMLWAANDGQRRLPNYYQAVNGWEVGFYHQHKDGTRFPVSLTRSPICDKNNNEIAQVAVARDITERIETEDQLRRANLQLKGFSRLKSESTILLCRQLQSQMDELKNTLSVAASTLSSEMTHQFIERIAAIETCLKDMRMAGELDNKKIRLNPSEFTLNELTDDVRRQIEPAAACKSIALNISLPDVTITLEADFERLSQAIVRLVQHSMRNSPDQTTIMLKVKDMGNEIAVLIQDQAPAIDPNQSESLLDRYEIIQRQLRNGQDDIDFSTAIAREFIDLHGGCLWIEPNTEQGNNYCFTLPKYQHTSDMAALMTSGTGETKTDGTK